MSYTIQLNPDRATWLEFRKNGLGGSDIAPLLGESPWTSRYELWYQKKNKVDSEDISDKPKVKAGVVLEPVIRNLFAENHPELMVFDTSVDGSITTFVSNERPWAMADLDGVALDLADPSAKPTIVEIKTAHMPFAKDWGPSGSGAEGVPKHYRDQVNHYFSITGWDKAYVAVYIDGFDYREYEIDRNDSEVEMLAFAEDTFWQNCILGDEVPEMTGKNDSKSLFQRYSSPSRTLKRITEAEQDEVADLIGTWIQAKEDANAAKVLEDTVAAKLKEKIGDAKGIALTEGNLTWVRTLRNRTNYKAMEAEDPATVRAYDDLRKKHTKKVTTDGGIRWNPSDN